MACRLGRWMLLCAVSGGMLVADEPGLPLVAMDRELPMVVDEDGLMALTRSVDRGLAALAHLQQEDGGFRTIRHARVGVTSLGVMAYLSRGHLPGKGEYGQLLERAIDYVLLQQKPSGMISDVDIDSAKIHSIPSHDTADDMIAKSYNHAIAMMMLGEAYGLMGEEDSQRIRQAIERGLVFSLQLWDIREGRARDDGGFRYTRPWVDRAEADISVTAWFVTAFRSIRNAGFEVPKAAMNRVAGYVKRAQNRDGGFGYISGHGSNLIMTAAGVLSLALSGDDDVEAIQRGAEALRFRHFRRGSDFHGDDERRWPYYGCYYVSQACMQTGGGMWSQFMPRCIPYLMKLQAAGGAWRPVGAAAAYGPAYSTSMACLTLGTVFQILPIYQR